jgi:transcriptional regulator GlxA family with amidase domain
MHPEQSRLIVFVAFDGMRALDLTGPLDAFAFTEDLRGPERPVRYRLRVVSAHGGPLRTSSGLVISTEPMSALAGEDIDTLIVAGGAAALRHGSPVTAVAQWLASHHALVDWIARRAPQVRRLCCVCTGTFLLAAAGQLAGRTVATHWASAQLLADCFADLRVEPDRIFCHDGPVWSSGGVTAGIDLALALIEDDFGREAALKTARVMVVCMKRAGGQSQFSVPLAAQISDRGDFAALHAWMWEHLAGDLRIDELAEQAGMSRRTFMRRYAAATGRTPAKTIETMRLDAVRAALEGTSKTLKQIARDAGFGDEDRMRRAFRRQFGVNPNDYRDRFSPRPRGPAGRMRVPHDAGPAPALRALRSPHPQVEIDHPYLAAVQDAP